MTVNPVAGKGAQLKIGNGASTEVFTALGRLENVNIAGLSRQIINLTTHDIDYIQKLASFRDNGAITFGVALDSADTQHLLLFTKFFSAAKTNFQLILPDTGDLAFNITAIIQNIAIPDAKSNTLMLNVSLDCEVFEIDS